MSQTGVGPYSHNEDIKVKAYYQWVPFVLFLQVTISSLYSLSCLDTHNISFLAFSMLFVVNMLRAIAI